MKWWQEAVFYQIYPRSFADGNGDGIGDFPGISSRLDYLKSLGVGALWLSPHYPSPMKDCGYDVSDYRGVAPEYGTLEDFTAFLRESHARGIRVILDLVLNHSSDMHPWFIESASGRDNPKADWYVWRDPRPGFEPGSREAAPNDWQSLFDGSAWAWCPARGQYYYHMFMPEQPDLNWSNPEVREAIHGAVRFWLDLGVDGFRLDAVGTLFEDPALTPQGTGFTMEGLREYGRRARTPWARRRAGKIWTRMFRWQFGQPGVHEVMKGLRALVDSYPGDRVLLAEDDNVSFLGDGRDELHMVFNFPLMNGGAITPAKVLRNQAERLAAHRALPFPGWPCNTLGNHDSPRMLSRFGSGESAGRIARLNAALMMTLRGTPVLYNGEEIGMADHCIQDAAQLRDPPALRYYEQLVGELGEDPAEAAAIAGKQSRDRCRTPHQWGPGPNADFCPPEASPWLPVNPDHRSGVNVAAQDGAPDSMLSFYRRLGALRLSLGPLRGGDWRPLRQGNRDVLCFLRSSGPEKVLVALNYSGRSRRLSLPPGTAGRAAFIEGTIEEPSGTPLAEGSPAGRGAVMGPWAILLATLRDD